MGKRFCLFFLVLAATVLMAQSAFAATCDSLTLDRTGVRTLVCEINTSQTIDNAGLVQLWNSIKNDFNYPNAQIIRLLFKNSTVDFSIDLYKPTDIPKNWEVELDNALVRMQRKHVQHPNKMTLTNSQITCTPPAGQTHVCGLFIDGDLTLNGEKADTWGTGSVAYFHSINVLNGNFTLNNTNVYNQCYNDSPCSISVTNSTGGTNNLTSNNSRIHFAGTAGGINVTSGNLTFSGKKGTSLENARKIYVNGGDLILNNAYLASQVPNTTWTTASSGITVNTGKLDMKSSTIEMANYANINVAQGDFLIDGDNVNSRALYKAKDITVGGKFEPKQTTMNDAANPIINLTAGSINMFKSTTYIQRQINSIGQFRLWESSIDAMGTASLPLTINVQKIDLTRSTLNSRNAAYRIGKIVTDILYLKQSEINMVGADIEIADYLQMDESLIHFYDPNKVQRQILIKDGQKSLSVGGQSYAAYIYSGKSVTDNKTNTSIWLTESGALSIKNESLEPIKVANTRFDSWHSTAEDIDVYSCFFDASGSLEVDASHFNLYSGAAADKQGVVASVHGAQTIIDWILDPTCAFLSTPAPTLLSISGFVLDKTSGFPVTGTFSGQVTGLLSNESGCSVTGKPISNGLIDYVIGVSAGESCKLLPNRQHTFRITINANNQTDTADIPFTS